MESPFQNLDADTEELDIPHFVGDLRALMVDDSEDEIVLDSDDDEAISDQKHGKIRGKSMKVTRTSILFVSLISYQEVYGDLHNQLMFVLQQEAI